MTTHEELIKKIPEIEAVLHYTFRDKALLQRAFMHSSYLNEMRKVVLKHNECLEFVGDSVLNLIVADYLFQLFPERSEGELSSMRSVVVSSHACIEYVKRMGLEKYIIMGKGERIKLDRMKSSIFADFYEALLGAIYLDGGIEKARQFFIYHSADQMIETIQKPSRNFKAELQELTQKTHQLIPRYAILKQLGPDHEKKFQVGVSLDDKLIGEGFGASKKEAEQQAAEQALYHLKREKQ